MKKRIRAVLCMICMVIGMNLLLAGCFYYAVNCKKTLQDTSVSPDERYELTLIEIGEPAWPFGSASGQLILNEGATNISQTDFELRNDGCSISSNDWAVTWNENYVEVILSGEEQFDERILLYFDGTMQCQTLILWIFRSWRTGKMNWFSPSPSMNISEAITATMKGATAEAT